MNLTGKTAIVTGGRILAFGDWSQRLQSGRSTIGAMLTFGQLVLPEQHPKQPSTKSASINKANSAGRWVVSVRSIASRSVNVAFFARKA